jgi:hypothetical protein
MKEEFNPNKHCFTSHQPKKYAFCVDFYAGGHKIVPDHCL